MKKNEIIEMLKKMNLIVVEGTDECEEDMIYIYTDELLCEEVDEVIETLTSKCDTHIKGTWEESWIFGQYEVITEYDR